MLCVTMTSGNGHSSLFSLMLKNTIPVTINPNTTTYLKMDVHVSGDFFDIYINTAHIFNTETPPTLSHKSH